METKIKGQTEYQQTYYITNINKLQTILLDFQLGLD